MAAEGHKSGETLWHNKYTQLLEKYGKVTIDEHQVRAGGRDVDEWAGRGRDGKRQRCSISWQLLEKYGKVTTDEHQVGREGGEGIAT